MSSREMLEVLSFLQSSNESESDQHRTTCIDDTNQGFPCLHGEGERPCCTEMLKTMVEQKDMYRRNKQNKILLVDGRGSSSKFGTKGTGPFADVNVIILHGTIPQL